MKIIAKKSLGQNFLIDQNIIDKITSISPIYKKNILEIGPGTGNLTENILKKKPESLFVIEKDESLCKLLSKKFSNEIEIINEDVLKMNLNNMFSKKKLLVFGNLPYNISTEIICNWVTNLEKEIWFDELILMFQKEVAERIIASENTSKFGRLSILLNWRLDIKKIFDIGPNSFNPKPKIESSVLQFMPKKNMSNSITQKMLKLFQEFFLIREEK